VDKASWHRGALITQVLADHPHLERYPLPSYSPKLQGSSASGSCYGVVQRIIGSLKRWHN
jgi:hypothetical protein